MYYKSIILFLTIVFYSCSEESRKDSGGTPGIHFYQNDFDFGTIQMGETVAHDFMFKNNGDGDLFISKVVSDCGCTVVDFRRDAITSGEESAIQAVFDSDGLPGFQMKKIIVHSNAGDSVVLVVSAVVDYELNNGFN